MATRSDVRFELRSGESWRDPFPMYAALRDHDPVHYAESGDFYVLTRFADVWAAAGDPETFSSAQGLTVAYDELDATGLAVAMPMVFLDPPAHTEFRRLVTRGLTPRQVSAIEPAVRAFVVERIESARAVGETDIVEHLFKPLPSFVVAHYLGVPAEDRALFDRWTEAIVQAAASGKPTAAGNPFAELLGYFASLIERRRTDPGDDIVSDLARLGEDAVTTARILGFAFTMVTGGNDTATGMLSGAACLLTEFLDQRARLLADPGSIPSAIEEVLRLTSPVQNLARTTRRDVQIHDVTIPAGKRVLLGYAAANRDPREFGPTAEGFDVGRPISKILTFSYGTHYCIGAAAARLQGRVVLEEMLRRCPDFRVDVAAGRYAEGNYVRRHLSLPWRASAGAAGALRGAPAAAGCGGGGPPRRRLCGLTPARTTARVESLNELGFYSLAGAPSSPRVLIDEVQEAERLGIGSVFLSERFNIKEAASLSGAAGAVSQRLGIATAATNQNTRHPIVTASFATTMHRLTGGRFTLGLGRGIDMIFDMLGLPRIKTAEMEDFAGLMRRLWQGEMIFGHDGPAGKFGMLSLDPTFHEAIPLLLTAFAPRSLRLAGRAFDAVVLHTFFPDETVVRCVDTVRREAERVGRDPAAVRIWSCFAVVGDHIPEPLRLKKTVGRLATYLQGYGPLLVKTNRWDPAVLERFWQDPLVGSFRGAIDDKATSEELEQIATLLPAEWLAPAATGSPERCVAAILHQFDLGVDGVILHGATPGELEPILEEYRRRRPAGRFAHLPVNPGAAGVVSG